MEIKLMISADESAMRFAELIGGAVSGVVAAKSIEPTRSEGGSFVGIEPMGEFTTQDVKMETAPEINTIEDVVEVCDNLNEIRKSIKAEAIRVVKAKKRDELKALNTEFGISKVDELHSDQLQDYLDKVSSL